MIIWYPVKFREISPPQAVFLELLFFVMIISYGFEASKDQMNRGNSDIFLKTRFVNY